jgi:hypothetical protein
MSKSLNNLINWKSEAKKMYKHYFGVLTMDADAAVAMQRTRKVIRLFIAYNSFCYSVCGLLNNFLQSKKMQTDKE